MTSWRLVSVAAALLFALALPSCSDGDQAGPAEPQQPLETPTTMIGGASLDLASVTPLTIISGTAEGTFGSDSPALTSGDFNGDGIDDLLIGARFADGPDAARTNTGEAYVLLGRADLPETVDMGAGQHDVTIYGASPEDSFGFSAAAGDLNGDGTDDMIIGALSAGSPESRAGDAGAVYVVYGRSDLPPTLDIAANDYDVVLLGNSPDSFFGDSVAVGDVNGDQLDDLIVGATFDRHSLDGQSATRGGAVYTFFGRRQWPSRLRAGEDYDVAVFGADDFDELGDQVAAGDFTGDGLADVAMAAEAADGPENDRSVAAEVYVLFGATDLGGSFLVSQADQDVTIFGANAGDTLGFSLAAGDIDGDGFDDLAMGARLADTPRASEAGSAYVLFGGSDIAPVIDLRDPPDDVSVFHGADAADFLGSSVAVGEAGAIAGKGILALGAAFADGPLNARAEAGEAYVVDAGRDRGIVSSVDGAAEFTIYGASAGDLLGASLVVADPNGDGRPELVVVAPEADGFGGQRQTAGQIYLVTLPP